MVLSVQLRQTLIQSHRQVLHPMKVTTTTIQICPIPTRNSLRTSSIQFHVSIKNINILDKFARCHLYYLSFLTNFISDQQLNFTTASNKKLLTPEKNENQPSTNQNSKKFLSKTPVKVGFKDKVTTQPPPCKKDFLKI